MAQSLRTKAIDPKRFPDYRYGSAEKKKKKTKPPRPKGSLIIGMAQVKSTRSLRQKCSLLTGRDLAIKKKKKKIQEVKILADYGCGSAIKDEATKTKNFPDYKNISDINTKASKIKRLPEYRQG